MMGYDDDNDQSYGSRHGGANDNGYGPPEVTYGGRPDTLTWFTHRHNVLIAHGVLAALSFVLFFPIGAILIRLSSFRGAWLLHGIIQIFAYITYTAAVGLGVWMVHSAPPSVDFFDNYHPVIGLVVFALLGFQPILGFIHHAMFKMHKRRTVWSYGHIWLGRILITLGMINGGLGMLLASDAPAFLEFRPSKGQAVAYGFVAGAMWVFWMFVAVYGEKRKSRILKDSKKAREDADSESGSGSPPAIDEGKERFA